MFFPSCMSMLMKLSIMRVSLGHSFGLEQGTCPMVCWMCSFTQSAVHDRHRGNMDKNNADAYTLPCNTHTVRSSLLM